jgi:Tfp pilus assembly protein PilF
MASTTTTPRQDSNPAALAELVNAGSAALSDGNLRLALDKFEAVVMAFPERPEGHNNLGALYSSIGEFGKAEACFDRVLAILPDNANILYNRGVVRSRLEKFDSACHDFTAVLQLTPEDPDALNNLGVAAFMQGRLAEARDHFTRALAARPDYTNALLNHIDLECAAGNTPAAVRMCETFLARTPNLEVRRKHLELLSSGCREGLEKASLAAESILAAEAANPEVRAELGRLKQARSLWASAAVATF